MSRYMSLLGIYYEEKFSRGQNLQLDRAAHCAMSNPAMPVSNDFCCVSLDDTSALSHTCHSEVIPSWDLGYRSELFLILLDLVSRKMCSLPGLRCGGYQHHMVMEA